MEGLERRSLLSVSYAPDPQVIGKFVVQFLAEGTGQSDNLAFRVQGVAGSPASAAWSLEWTENGRESVSAAETVSWISTRPSSGTTSLIGAPERSAP